MNLMRLLEKFEHHQMVQGRKDSADLIHQTRRGIAALYVQQQQATKRICILEVQLDIAKRMMDKLPRDADGRHVVPHVDVLWSWTDDSPIREFPEWQRREDTGSKWIVTDGVAIHDVSLCYSTLLAAEAARSATKGDNGG